MLKKTRETLFVFTCLTALAGGTLAVTAQTAFDASRLPRVTGAKEIFASPATTIFVSPNSVAHTADRLEQALAAVGWQRYETVRNRNVAANQARNQCFVPTDYRGATGIR